MGCINGFIHYRRRAFHTIVFFCLYIHELMHFESAKEYINAVFVLENVVLYRKSGVMLVITIARNTYKYSFAYTPQYNPREAF